MYDVIYEAEIALCSINKLALQLKIDNHTAYKYCTQNLKHRS
jgi:hypothetical protein